MDYVVCFVRSISLDLYTLVDGWRSRAIFFRVLSKSLIIFISDVFFFFPCYSRVLCFAIIPKKIMCIDYQIEVGWYFPKYNPIQKVSTHKINWNAPPIKIRSGTRWSLAAPTINQLTAFIYKKKNPRKSFICLQTIFDNFLYRDPIRSKIL